jgi:hypothetical protein
MAATTREEWSPCYLQSGLHYFYSKSFPNLVSDLSMIEKGEVLDSHKLDSGFSRSKCF